MARVFWAGLMLPAIALLVCWAIGLDGYSEIYIHPRMTIWEHYVIGGEPTSGVWGRIKLEYRYFAVRCLEDYGNFWIESSRHGLSLETSGSKEPDDGFTFASEFVTIVRYSLAVPIALLWLLACGLAFYRPPGFYVRRIRVRLRSCVLPPGHWPCPRCGYDLHGNTSGRCPECGVTAVGAERAQGQQAS